MMETKEMLEKANKLLQKEGKKITLHDNANGNYAIYVNGALLFYAVPEERLLLNIAVAFFANITC